MITIKRVQDLDEKIENVIKNKNSIIIVYCQMGSRSLKAIKKNDDAIDLYKTALNLDSKNTQVKAKLFELMKDTMPTEELLTYLHKNVQNEPMNADTYYESTCGGVTKYAIKTCISCYSKSGNTCVKDTCPTVNCTNGSCYTDTCGCEVLYDCNSGYEMNGNSCKACTWSGYTLTSKNVSNAASYYSATCDGTTKYAVKTCNSCYYKSGNACYEEECASVDCSNATCYTDSCGCDYISSCDSCYSKSGNSCVKNSCTTSCPSYAVCTYDSCGCRTGFTCNNGYEKSGSSCVASCSCSMTSCPDNATCSYSSDGCDCVTSFTCDSCYSKSGSSCVKKTCSTTSCPENRSCSEDSCGCVTVGGCASGYRMCGGNCVQYCYSINSSYWDSCPSSATCGYDSSSCCYYMTGCQPGYHQCYEGQHRTFPRRRHYRGIPCGKRRTRLPDYLLQSGIQA